MSKSDDKRPMWILCGKCRHEWILLYTPMEMGLVGKAMKSAMCPMCGAGVKDIFLRANHPEAA